MVRNDLAGADFRGVLKGDVLVKPGGMHHARDIVFLRAQHALDQIAHAVHQPHACLRVPHGHLRRLVRHKLGLRGHDGAARPAHRQRVHRAGALVRVVLQGQNHLLHKARDKRGFAGSHRADHADVDVSARAVRDIPVQIERRRLLLCLQSRHLRSGKGMTAGRQSCPQTAGLRCGMKYGILIAPWR